jgi:hypothetical protein
MQFDEDVDLPEHTHEDQVGFVLEGKIEFTYDGTKHVFTKGDRFHIEKGKPHSGKIYAGYADITFFNQVDRYKVKWRLASSGAARQLTSSLGGQEKHITCIAY